MQLFISPGEVIIASLLATTILTVEFQKTYINYFTRVELRIPRRSNYFVMNLIKYEAK